MSQMNAQTVENLKAANLYEAAGQLAAHIGADRWYGQHYGMRSNRARSMERFYAAYDAQALREHQQLAYQNAGE